MSAGAGEAYNLTAHALHGRPAHPLPLLDLHQPRSDPGAPGRLGAAQGHRGGGDRRRHPPGLAEGAEGEAHRRGGGAVHACARRPAPPRRARRRPPRFLLSAEVCTIYRRGDRTRKVHHLVLLPGFAAAEALQRRLGRHRQPGLRWAAGAGPGFAQPAGDRPGGLPGRPASSRPTSGPPGSPPWATSPASTRSRSATGTRLSTIYAVETGLSSDPPMNWRVRLPGPLRPGLQLRRPLAGEAGPGGQPVRHGALLPGHPGRVARLRAAGRPRPPGADGARRLPRHHRVLPPRGQVPLRRAPQVRRVLGAGPDPRAARPVPGVRQAGDRGRAEPRGPASATPAATDFSALTPPPGRPGFHSLIPLKEILAELAGLSGSGAQSRKVARLYDELLVGPGASWACCWSCRSTK